MKDGTDCPACDYTQYIDRDKESPKPCPNCGYDWCSMGGDSMEKEDFILQGSCSTSVMRIKLTGLKPYEILRIEQALEKLDREHSEQDSGPYQWWYETSWNREKVFGTDVMKIHGDAPFNSYDELMAYLNEECPFIERKKVEIENGDQD